MNIQELDTQHLQLIEGFIRKYLLCRQTMSLQEEYTNKSRTFERVLVEEYQWMIDRESAQKHILCQMGLLDVIKELEKFIERWKYNVLDAHI
jgi:hypothetical protein